MSQPEDGFAEPNGGQQGESKLELQSTGTINTSLQNKTFSCGLCQQKFDNKDRLLRHLKNAHWEPRQKPDLRLRQVTE